LGRYRREGETAQSGVGIMPINSRNKGAAFERAIAARLFGLTGVSFKRDIEQYRAADHGDLLPDDGAWPFAIECKRYAAGTGCKPAWRQQASKAASVQLRFPAVIYKFDRCDIWVSVPFDAIAAAFDGKTTGSTEWAEITIEGLAYLAAEIMAWRK
jgi:hypothetical protein